MGVKHVSLFSVKLPLITYFLPINSGLRASYCGSVCMKKRVGIVIVTLNGHYCRPALTKIGKSLTNSYKTTQYKIP